MINDHASIHDQTSSVYQEMDGYNNCDDDGNGYDCEGVGGNDADDNDYDTSDHYNDNGENKSLMTMTMPILAKLGQTHCRVIMIVLYCIGDVDDDDNDTKSLMTIMTTVIVMAMTMTMMTMTVIARLGQGYRRVIEPSLLPILASKDQCEDRDE